MGRQDGNRARRGTRDREASIWVARHSLGELGPEEASRFALWYSDPEHSEAYDRLWWALTRVDSAGPVARAAHHKAILVGRQRRRRALTMGTTLCLVAVLTVPQLDLSARFADMHTGRGEIRRVQLADGSRLWLDADSAADIAIGDHSRELSLVRGRVHVDVAHEARPFVVRAGRGVVRDLGTAFDVEKTPEGAETIVTQGRVVAQTGGDELELRAGEGAAWSEGAAPHRLVDATPVAQTSWRDGRLRFERQPLSDVISALDRYSKKRLILWNARAGRRIVSGVVNAQQADQEIAALAQSQDLSTTNLGFAIILR